MRHVYTRMSCCGQEASDAMLTRTLTHCLRAILADPHKNIQLLVNLGDVSKEIQQRDIDPGYVAERVKQLSAAWDAGQDFL